MDSIPTAPPPPINPPAPGDSDQAETPRTRDRHADGSYTTSIPADLAKDLGAIALFFLALGSTFWVSGFRPYTVAEEWPLTTLATLTVVGVVASRILLRLTAVPAPTAHLLRLVPSVLLTAAALLYLLLMSVGVGVAASEPGIGNGFLVVLALGIVAALPRSGDPMTRDPRIWMWFGLAIAACAGLANLLLPFFSDDWEADSFNVASVVLNVLFVVLVPLVALWPALGALRPALRIMGLALLAFAVLNAFNEEQALFAGGSGAALEFPEALLIAGLLSFGVNAEKQSGRRFAQAASILALATAVLDLAPNLLMAWGDGEIALTPPFWSIAGGAVALIVFLALHRGRRRAQVLPAMIAAAVLFALTTLVHILGSYSDAASSGVSLAITVLLLIALVRVDRDPGFDILPANFRANTGSEATQLHDSEARAYQQSAAALAVFSVVTGPAGILLSLSSFHRARQAEDAGLLTNAIRIIAGFGMSLGVISIFAWPLWTTALQSF